MTVWIAIAAAVLVAVLGGRRLLRPAAAADIKVFPVHPMSFPVVLKEKGEVKARKSVDIKNGLEGRSTIIWLIPEGSMVHKGDLLVELASQEIDEKIRNQEIQVATLQADVEAAQREYEIQLDENTSNIRKAELKLELAKLELEKYVKGDHEQKLREATLLIDQARATLVRKQDDYQNSLKLAEQGYITKTELADDQFEEYKAQMELEKAELAKRILVQYTHPATVAQKETDVDEAKRELARVKNQAEAMAARRKAALDSKKAQLEIVQGRLVELREQKDLCKLHAPAPGLVVYANSDGRWGRQPIEEGAEVHRQQTIIQLPDTTVMQVVVRIHESQTDKVTLGQRALITVEGLPGKTFNGAVTKIAPLADSRNRWLNPDLKEYTTEITLEQAEPGLKPGVTAETEILVDYLENVNAVPIQAVYGYGGQQYVFVREGGQARPVKVELGLASTEYVQVLGGVEPGQEVMMIISEPMKQLLAQAGNGQDAASASGTDDLLRSLAAGSQPTDKPKPEGIEDDSAASSRPAEAVETDE